MAFASFGLEEVGAEDAGLDDEPGRFPSVEYLDD